MKRLITGLVTSDKQDKTIVVEINVRKTHPIYKKQYTVSRKYYAHDEKNEANAGDKVEIVETRKMSKNKVWALNKVIEKAKE